MKITPQDILTQKFKVRVKGFDREEVKSFLIQISDFLEKETQEKERLKREIDKIRNNLANFEKREIVLRETMVTAQKYSNEIRLSTKKEAELVMKEAEIKADDIIKTAMDRHKDLREEIRSLKFKRKEIEDDLLKMLDSLKGLIESYRQEDEEFDKVEYLNK